MSAVALLCHCETIFIQTEITLANVLSTSQEPRMGFSQPSFLRFSHFIFNRKSSKYQVSFYPLLNRKHNYSTNNYSTCKSKLRYRENKEMPMCGISNPQLCLQTSLIVTVIPSSWFFLPVRCCDFSNLEKILFCGG